LFFGLGVPPKWLIVLKTCAKTLAPGMTKIFQKSIDCSELPDDWLSANVAPVYKKGPMAFDGFMSLSSSSTHCSPIFRVFMLNSRSMVDFSSVVDVLFVKTDLN
jgi:hypothetical protein